jgi:hypothetical protein
VRLQGRFSFFGIEFVDPIYPRILNRPVDSEDYLEELHCFHSSSIDDRHPLMSDDVIFGLQSIDRFSDDVHPPYPLKFAQELLDSVLEFFTCSWLLIQANMSLFKEVSVKPSIFYLVKLMVSVRADVGTTFPIKRKGK